jgi:hypothetical protein
MLSPARALASTPTASTIETNDRDRGIQRQVASQVASSATPATSCSPSTPPSMRTANCATSASVVPRSFAADNLGGDDRQRAEQTRGVAQLLRDRAPSALTRP